MDRKSMEATYTVAQMETEHFAGGFHSADVRSTFATIKDADPQTKHELYRDAFNEAYDLATEIQNHPRYVEGKADACWTYVAVSYTHLIVNIPSVVSKAP